MKNLIKNYHNRYAQAVYWATILLQSRFSNYFGSYFVLGHPSSGTNWLCNLVSDYFEIPVFESWNEKIISIDSQVFHMHRFFAESMPRNRTIYMYRDGRDTLVSLFMKMAKSPWMGEWRVQFNKDTGVNVRAELAIEQLPLFIDWHFTRSQPSSLNWAEHIRKIQGGEYITVSFETLIHQPSDALRLLLTQLGISQINEKQLNASVSKNDIVNLRTAENIYQIRSGRPGEWHKYFSLESAKCFHKYAGKELIALGYEMNDSWVNDATPVRSV